jgi:hypothetical protein
MRNFRVRARTRAGALLLACAVSLAGAVAFSPAGAASANDSPIPANASPIPPQQRRSVEQTFLTFPEWFLVHSPAEYARFIGAQPAHGFPFLGHIEQIWSSYHSVTREQLRAGYPGNPGYHVMICVIAGSTTLEYGLRSLYENTIGRISWASSSGALTAEDRYGAAVAQDYVDFIRKEPWYLYDFSSKLAHLWSSTPAWGPDMLRKWERRYALTTEYLVKAAYGKLIGAATHAAYDPALMTTQVVTNHVPAGFAPPPGVTLLRSLPDGRTVMELPRYFDFRIAAANLADQGVELTDIAGNDSVILVTAIANAQVAVAPAGSRVLFAQPIITRPGLQRTAVILPVAGLSRFLATAKGRGIEVEHVYDY